MLFCLSVSHFSGPFLIQSLLYGYSVSINGHKTYKFIRNLAVRSIPWITDLVSVSVKIGSRGLPRFVRPVAITVQPVPVEVAIQIVLWITFKRNKIFLFLKPYQFNSQRVKFSRIDKKKEIYFQVASISAFSIIAQVIIEMRAL